LKELKLLKKIKMKFFKYINERSKMKNLFAMLSVLILLSTSSQAIAVTIKIAALVPEGTNWAKTIKKMSKEIKKATDGKVKFKVYYGGVAGDEPDVLRKVRVGQLHGGVFTGKTLGDIDGDIRALEIPFNFYDKSEKAGKAIKGMNTFFNTKLSKKGFKNLGFYEIGQVYLVSTKKVSSIEEMKGIKIWSWEGDEVVKSMVDSLKLVSVPLSLPDVLSSLSTGIIGAAYAPPLGILALQWQSKIKYLIDFPVAYSTGALLISNKRWKKIKPEHQKIIEDISAKYITNANEFASVDNKAGLETLKSLGVEFTKFKKSDLDKAEMIRKDVIKKLEGKVISKKAIDLVNQYR
jgi:TRAP-type C4-dicarboxylate transport system substrate-binding protein